MYHYDLTQWLLFFFVYAFLAGSGSRAMSPSGANGG